MPVFGKKSLERLEGVHPNLVKVLKAAILTTPIDFTIIEGQRTAKTQAMYYTWGRTVVNPNTGPIPGNKFGMIVTGRNGVSNKSNHQVKADGYGHAVDLYPYVNGKVYMIQKETDGYLRTISNHIKKVAATMGIGITWGGDFKKPYDPPHFELK